MKWLISVPALLTFLIIILLTGGVWEITFNPDRFLEVPDSIWLTLLMMVFIVFLCIFAGKVLDSQKDDQS